MDTKQEIIKKILSDAENKADEILQKAENEKALAIKEANDWAQDYVDGVTKDVKEQGKSIVEKRKTAGKMDNQKLALKAKREVMDEVFMGALEKMNKMPKKKYGEFVNKLIEDYATEGDDLLLAKNSPLNETDVKSLSAYSKKNLNFVGTADFNGGIILSNENFETNLSFENIISWQKIEVETELSKKLF